MCDMAPQCNWKTRNEGKYQASVKPSDNNSPFLVLYRIEKGRSAAELGQNPRHRILKWNSETWQVWRPKFVKKIYCGLQLRHTHRYVQLLPRIVDNV